MGIKLRDGEEVKAEVDLHWSIYILPGAWAFMISPSILIAIFSSAEKTPPIGWLIALAYSPIIYTLLKNKTKTYVITNERIYVEEGIFAKSKRDIPLSKINDLEITQGPIQRVFGAGNVFVLTGNNKPTKLTHIDSVEKFRDTASSLIATKRVG